MIIVSSDQNSISFTVSHLRFQKYRGLDVLEGPHRTEGARPQPPEGEHRHLQLAVARLHLRRSLLFGRRLTLVRLVILLLLLQLHQDLLHFVELLGDLVMMFDLVLRLTTLYFFPLLLPLLLEVSTFPLSFFLLG